MISHAVNTKFISTLLMTVIALLMTAPTTLRAVQQLAEYLR